MNINSLYLLRFDQIKAKKRDFRQVWIEFSVNEGGDGLCGFEGDENWKSNEKCGWKKLWNKQINRIKSHLDFFRENSPAFIFVNACIYFREITITSVKLQLLSWNYNFFPWNYNCISRTCKFILRLAMAVVHPNFRQNLREI